MNGITKIMNTIEYDYKNNDCIWKNDECDYKDDAYYFISAKMMHAFVKTIKIRKVIAKIMNAIVKTMDRMAKMMKAWLWEQWIRLQRCECNYGHDECDCRDDECDCGDYEWYLKDNEGDCKLMNAKAEVINVI